MITEELKLLITSNTTGAIAGMTGVENKAKAMATSLAGGMTAAGAAMTKGITLPLVGIGVAAAKMSVEFEAGMAQIKALVGVSDAELAELSQAALDMGSKYGIAATDAAGGLFFLKSAGLDNANAMEALEVASIAAAAGLGDLESLSNGMTTVMTNFGFTAEEAMDKFIMAARKAKADPAELGHVLNKNAAIAATVGMSFDDLAGLTAFLTTALGDTRASGTAMTGMLNKMIKPSQMAKDALGEIGLTGEEFSKMMAEDLVGSLHLLDSEFTAIGKNDWMGKVFEDSEAIKGVASILNQEADHVREFGESVEDSAGLVNEAWDVMGDTSKVKLAQFFEGLKSTLIPVGDIIMDALIPALETLGDYVQKGAKWFQNLDESMQKNIVKFGGLAAAIGPMLTIGGKVLSLFIGFNPWVLAVAAAIGGLVWIAKELGIGFGDVVAFVQPVIDVLSSLWDYVKYLVISGDHLNDFLTELPEPLQNVAKFLGEAFLSAKKFFGSLFSGGETIGGLGKSLSGFVAGLGEVFGTVLESIRVIWEDVWGWAGPFIADFIDTVMVLVGTLVEWFQENWPLILATVQHVLDVIMKVWTAVWPVIQTILEVAWNAIKGIVTAAINIVLGIITTVMAIITGDWGRAWEGIKQIFSGVWTAIKTVLSTALGAIRVVIEGAIGIIKGIWEVGWGLLGSGVEAVWDGIVGAVKWGANQVIDFINGMIAGALEGINMLIEAANKIPGVNMGTLSFEIPKLANGGDIASGGLAMVGERGREVVSLPTGARVTPLDQAGGSNQTIILQLEGEEVARVVLDATGLSQTRQTRRTA